jgi:hypothetical protein
MVSHHGAAVESAAAGAAPGGCESFPQSKRVFSAGGSVAGALQDGLTLWGSLIVSKVARRAVLGQWMPPGPTHGTR